MIFDICTHHAKEDRESIYIIKRMNN